MLMKTTTLAAMEKPMAGQVMDLACARMIGKPKADMMMKEVMNPATSSAPFGELKSSLILRAKRKGKGERK